MMPIAPSTTAAARMCPFRIRDQPVAELYRQCEQTDPRFRYKKRRDHGQPNKLLTVHIAEHVVGAKGIGVRNGQRRGHHPADQHRYKIGKRERAEGGD